MTPWMQPHHHGHAAGGRFGQYAPADAPVYSHAIASRLFAYLAPHRGPLSLALLFTLLATAMSLAGPYLLKLAIDDYIAVGDWPGLTLVVAAALASQGIAWVAAARQTYLVASVSQQVLNLLRSQLFQHIQRLSLGYHDRHPTGATLSRVVNDVEVMHHMLTNGVVHILMDVGLLVGIVAIMLSFNTYLALLTFSVLPLMVLATAIFTVRARTAFRDTREKMGAVTAGFQANVSAVRVIQAFAREEESQMAFDRINEENRRANIHANTLSAAFAPTVELSSILASAIVIWFGGRLVLEGELTLGVLVAFLAYVTRFFNPIRELSQVYSTFQQAMAGGERIFQLLDTPPAIADPPHAFVLPRLEGRVEFRNVHLSYVADAEALRGIELVVAPGQTVALVGPTGAGKTSLVNLIPRLYEVSLGAVLVDGRDVREVELASLRGQMALVPQENFLFSATIADNIRFGRPGASDEQVERAARLVGAHEFIRRLPERYQTPVMERGANLSLGQRQLLAFARAILADPRILILDEATSAVDSQTEARLQAATSTLLQGRTCFVIAHRLSTVRHADVILVMEAGQIVERGPYSTLMDLHGRFYQMVTAQLGQQRLPIAS